MSETEPTEAELRWLADRLEITALKAEVAKLRREIGQFETRQDTAKRPEELPNGDYNVAFRQRQIGEAIDQVVETVARMEARFLRLEAGSAQSPAVSAPANLQELAEKLLPYLPASGASSSLRGEKDAALFMRANTARAETQDGITDEYDGELQLAGGDGGLRILQNYNCRGTRQLPWSVFGPNSHGGWEYNWYPAINGFQDDGGDYAKGQGTGNYWEQGIFDEYGRQINGAYKGQTLLVDGGSQGATAGDQQTYLSRKRHLMIAAQRESWPIYLCVTPKRNPYPSNMAVLKLDAANNGEQNRVLLFVDGELRRVKARADGTLYYDVGEGGR